MKLASALLLLCAVFVLHARAETGLTLPEGTQVGTATPAQLSTAVAALSALGDPEIKALTSNIFSALENADRKEAAAVITAFARKFPSQILIVVEAACAAQPALAPIVSAAATGEISQKSKEIAAAAKAGVNAALASTAGGRLKKILDAIDLAVAGALKSGPIDGWAWTSPSGARAGYVGAPFLNPANFQDDGDNDKSPAPKPRRPKKPPVVSPSD